MKRKIIAALAFSMLLCGCEETANSQNNSAPSEKTASSAATSAESTASEGTSETTAETPSAAQTKAESVTSTTAEEVSSAVSAAISTDAINGDLFAGLYTDETNSNWSLSIDNINDTLYNVNVTYKKSETETDEWQLSGEFNGRKTLHYDNCVKSIMTIDEDGAASSEKIYTDGSGCFMVAEEGTKTGFSWTDDKENAGSECFFIKQ